MGSPADPAFDDAGIFEDDQVLEDGGQRHAEGFGGGWSMMYWQPMSDLLAGK